ncbi:MAG: hypothetical protein KKA84_08065 [Bacteroidetes bacterium]|nr:hypothetical protein [Bacteroidota bacterium]
MKRRNGSIFWGGFFVALGSLILLARFDLFNSDWEFIWSWYPIALVFIGAMIMSKDTFIRPVVTGLFGIFVATLLYGSVSSIKYEVNFDWDANDNDNDYSEYYEEYKEGYDLAELSLKGGAGYFKIGGTTENLVAGRSFGSLGYYRFTSDEGGDMVRVEFNQRKKNFTFFDEDFKNRLQVRLNPNPVWDLDLDFGAAKANFDLSDFKTRNINIETGVTDIFLKLGEKYSETHVDISMGAASLIISLPKESGCKLTGDMVLFSKDLEDFNEVRRDDKKTYVTSNFTESENKIYIHIDGGMSKLEIKRY